MRRIVHGGCTAKKGPSCSQPTVYTRLKTQCHISNRTNFRLTKLTNIWTWCRNFVRHYCFMYFLRNTNLASPTLKNFLLPRFLQPRISTVLSDEKFCPTKILSVEVLSDKVALVVGSWALRTRFWPFKSILAWPHEKVVYLIGQNFDGQNFRRTKFFVGQNCRNFEFQKSGKEEFL